MLQMTSLDGHVSLLRFIQQDLVIKFTETPRVMFSVQKKTGPRYILKSSLVRFSHVLGVLGFVFPRKHYNNEMVQNKTTKCITPVESSCKNITLKLKDQCEELKQSLCSVAEHVGAPGKKRGNGH